jgi:hypothetical protein
MDTAIPAADPTLVGRLKPREPQVFAVEDLPEDLIAAIAAAEYGKAAD